MVRPDLLQYVGMFQWQLEKELLVAYEEIEIFQDALFFCKATKEIAKHLRMTYLPNHRNWNVIINVQFKKCQKRAAF
ncbi:hypothetical protein AKG39_18995 [Acetobacterium bakii]|uniref:Uncharacterized protein n=1 Tax=Acetobacterium bakii TaxID=52689 RepID=A0A0L6TV83_9FIRM|nr:hypothetical protein AKG39_18995 [Acetobacterium bakii]